MINMSVHMSMRLTYVTVSKPFSVRGIPRVGWGLLPFKGWSRAQTTVPKGVQEWFSKAWFGHKILKKIGSFAGDARLFHGCVSKPWDHEDIVWDYDCLHDGLCFS